MNAAHRESKDCQGLLVNAANKAHRVNAAKLGLKGFKVCVANAGPMD